MVLRLQSEQISVQVDTNGGQLVSVQNAKGLEYLWQGNPAFWAGQAPPLFPIVGGLRDNTALMPNGRWCRMGRHGLARRMEYHIAAMGDDFVKLAVQSDEKTREAYPYDFLFELTYCVNKDRVTTLFSVVNAGKEQMPFFVGGHPAFNCPLTAGEKFEDYILEFAETETAYCMTPQVETGLLNAQERVCILNNRRTLPMRHSLFQVDSIPFDSLRSRSARLLNPTRNHGVQIDFDGFDYFVVWSAQGDAPFVALEPWTGLATCTDEDDVFLHKRGVRTLEEGERFELGFDIKIF